MNQFIYSWIVALFTMLGMDFVWLNLTVTKFYKIYLGHLFVSQINYIPAVLFYILYAAGLSYILLVPALKLGLDTYEVFLRGAVIGAMAYGAYDLTNHATLLNWPTIITIVDMMWGMFVTAMTSVITVVLLKTYFK